MRTRTTVRTCRLAAGGLTLGLALALTGCGSDKTIDEFKEQVEIPAS